MGGIGKTALAQKLAADLDGHLPGGVFWADLPAHEGDPLPILAAWGHTCGHNLAGLADPQARADALRGCLAEHVRTQGRALAVLDDVRHEWLAGAKLLQTALPPGLPLLLTTRDEELALALDANVRRLDVLPLPKALALLADLAGPPVEQAPADAKRLAQRVGCLPLALELAGKLAALRGRKPGWRLAQLCDEIEARSGRALVLKGQPGLAATFSLSYDSLDAQGQRLFRTLGVFAPAPLAAEHVAAVLGWPQAEARLDALVALSLVRWEEGSRTSQQAGLPRPAVRYSLHPLLYDHARELLAASDQAPAARQAHTAHYLAYARAHRGATAADYDALEAERANLLAAMDRADREAQWAQVRRFAWALGAAGGYLWVRGYWAELGKRLEQAAHAAEAEGQPRDAASFSWTQAILFQSTGDLEKARQEYEQTLAIFEELGERRSVAGLYHQLGMLAQDTGAYDEARRLYEQSLEINEELGDRAGMATTLHQLGVLAQDTGDRAASRQERQRGYDEARRLYEQSLEIEEELGNRAGVAQSLGQLAILAKREGNPAEAERRYRQAIVIGQELGDVVNMSIDLFNLALLYEGQGRLAEALPLLEQAVEIAERVGLPAAENRRAVLERVRGKL